MEISSEDVAKAIDSCHQSAAGPDTIPIEAYKTCKLVASQILAECAETLLDPLAPLPPDWFNKGLLVLLPKKITPGYERYGEVYEPKNMRPLSIVGWFNRILANVFRAKLDSVVSEQIGQHQRGFLNNRYITQNIVEIDLEAKHVHIKGREGAIILFDFQAAFPSVDHEYIWQALAKWGVPCHVIHAYKCLYNMNTHSLRVQGQSFESVHVQSGVRQGCPLSPLLFVMAIGPKLKWIKSNIENKFYLILFFIISLMLSVLIVRNLETNFLFNTVLVTAAFYLLFTTLREFFNKKMINPSQNLAHFSFSLLILSILFNNIFSFEIVTNLRVNEIYETEKYKIRFESIEQKNKQNFKTIIGKFTVEQIDGDVDVMRPELRIYNQPNIVTSEADIKINIFYDKFMTMNYVQNQDYFNIRYQFKPFMFWIWVSTLMLSLSGLLSFARGKYEK